MKRSTTGAYMASAIVYSAPNSHGPPAPKRWRQSFHSSSIRSMSAVSAAGIAVWRLRARAFIGHSDRRVWNPECISAATERATARASRARGQPRPVSSAAYSQIASESHTRSAPARSTGTRPLGPQASSRSCVSGWSSGITTSSKLTPRCVSAIQARSDHEE